MTFPDEMMAAMIDSDLAAIITYTPPGGAAQSLRALVRLAEPDGISRQRAHAEKIIVEVLASAIDDVQGGALIVHAGKTFKVVSSDETPDDFRVLRRIQAAEVYI